MLSAKRNRAVLPGKMVSGLAHRRQICRQKWAISPGRGRTRFPTPTWGASRLFLFRPSEAVAARHRGGARNTKPTPSEPARRVASLGRHHAEQYDRMSYRQAVIRTATGPSRTRSWPRSGRSADPGPTRVVGLAEGPPLEPAPTPAHRGDGDPRGTGWRPPRWSRAREGGRDAVLRRAERGQSPGDHG